jgi:hypothetical protein
MRKNQRVYRHRPQEVVTVEDARAHSEADLKDAVAHVAAAFNMLDDAKLRYTFDEATCERVKDLCLQLMLLWKFGDLKVRAGAIAADDAGFQRLMREVVR